MLRLPLAGVAAAVLLLGIAGCGKTTVDQSSEVNLVNKSLANSHLKAKSVDCPSDVEAKEGETFSCTAELTTGGTATVDIKVGNVSNDQAQLKVTGGHVSGKGG